MGGTPGEQEQIAEGEQLVKDLLEVQRAGGDVEDFLRRWVADREQELRAGKVVVCDSRGSLRSVERP